ncbi:MAG: large conductance mechanosensitive channel protein MscL [Chthonomonas sp.]|nr:large conductance mechanosensitive channel protein MscL [Chthonomonas sp.]
MGMIQEFKDFINKGNVMDLAVGVIIGGAFGKIVESLVADIVMPLIAKAGGQPDFSAWEVSGVKVGNFLNALIAFLIIAFVVFLIVKALNKLKKPAVAEAAATPEDIVLLREIRDSLKR